MRVLRINMRILLASVATVIAVTAMSAVPVDAGKGGGGKGGGTTASITLNQTEPHLGDTITFTASGGSRIAVACYQGGIGDMVWSADQPVGTAFLLGGTSSAWTSAGGEALCYAWLYSRSLSRGAAASTSFWAGGWR